MFNYAPDASVNLNAYGVYLTDASVPRLANENVPIIYPSILDISAGAGGITIDGEVNLFPSPEQNLTLTTTDGGDLTGVGNAAAGATLYMSDSSATQWSSSGSTFTVNEQVSTLPENLNNPNPVVVNISGDMENLNLVTSTVTQLTVDGNMLNSGFSGQNLQANEVTTLTVLGEILDNSAYAFVNDVSIPNVPADLLPTGTPESWEDIFALAMDPTFVTKPIPPQDNTSSQWASYAYGTGSLFGALFQNGELVGNNPGFSYNPATGQLGFGGPMSQSVLSILTGSITVLEYSGNVPVTKTIDGQTYFQTTTINWLPASEDSQLQALYTASQSDPSPDSSSELGYRVGGPGAFDVVADSISLGNSYGILTSGAADSQGESERFVNLASISPSGASLDVSVNGDLSMLTSTIATIGGGDLNVTAASMDLGAEGLNNITRELGYGVYTSDGGNVTVTATTGDVDIDGSRIATYNGGNILIVADDGNVQVGSGGDVYNNVALSYVDPTDGQGDTYNEAVYGSGIVAYTLVTPPAGTHLAYRATAPGNITVETPRGDITAGLGGITQEALDGSIAGGPTVTLTAGTFPSDTSPGYTGNIDLGQGGVIGGTVNISANGNITGIVISRQNSNINAADSFSGAVLSGGSADVGAGGGVSGVIVGVGGASVSGSSVTAAVLGQNVSVNGGASQSTLGSSAAATSTSQSAAGEATSQAQQQVADNSSDDSNDNDDKKKKKPALLQHIKRVTVILPKSV